MDTCVRGFSFMPENKVEIMDLQYIEGGELERAWKINRRQRLKEQEQRIWDEFVKEQDVAKNVFTDDPYQFLHDLPEEHLKELMEAELKKMQKEHKAEPTPEKPEQPTQGEGDFQAERPGTHTVTFAEEKSDKEDSDNMFHIFDDDKDEFSGPDEEVVMDSPGSPDTVRERDSDIALPVQAELSAKSSENITSVIESSIYCARVKEIRLKINEELHSLMSALAREHVAGLARGEAADRARRAKLFSARFNRLHLYQLHSQMQSIERHAARAAPFAQHTHFLAHAARLLALHHAALHALQVFQRSGRQTSWLRECGGSLRALLAVLRRAAPPAPSPAPAPGRSAPLSPPPPDELMKTCDKVEIALDEYNEKVADFLSTGDTTSERTPRRSRKGKKKTHTLLSKSTSKSSPDTERRLSMYSFDTLRLNLKPSTSKGQSSGTSKLRGRLGSNGSFKQQDKGGPLAPKSHRKSPKGRRPLMRAPGGAGGAGGARGRGGAHDSEVSTMVEAVGTCTSSHISREGSPPGGARCSPRRSPRRPSHRPPLPSPHPLSSPHGLSPRKVPVSTPRQIIHSLILKPKTGQNSPKQGGYVKSALSSVRSNSPGSPGSSKIKTYRSPQQTAKYDEDVKQSTKGIRKVKEKIPTKNTKTNKHKESAIIGVDSARVGYSGSIPEHAGNDFCSSGNDLFLRESTIYTKDSCYENNSLCNRNTPRKDEEGDSNWGDRDKLEISDMVPARCEVTRLLRQLCSGDTLGNERISGSKNAQLICVTGSSPRQPSTPQLLRILEETIQKKTPRPMYPKPASKDPARYRLTFNIPTKTADHLFHYRTSFVQHMLASPMYANSAVGKPWEIIGSISETIVDELLLECAKEMQMEDVIKELYEFETN